MNNSQRPHLREPWLRLAGELVEHGLIAARQYGELLCLGRAPPHGGAGERAQAHVEGL